MSQKPRCVHCKQLFRPNPRLKEQSYCSSKACQRARKRLWQKQKMARDSDYQANQRNAQRTWQEENPDYWRHYRGRNPEYVRRNRLAQQKRNKERRPREGIAKMDTLRPFCSIEPGTYYLVSESCGLIAKMDALIQKVLIIPAGQL